MRWEGEITTFGIRITEYVFLTMRGLGEQKMFADGLRKYKMFA